MEAELNPLKSKLLSAASGAMLTALAANGVALAQDTQTDPVITTSADAETEQTLEQDKIVVTGTRIQRTNAQSSIPLQTFGAADLEEIGTTDLAEALVQIPGVSESVSPTNSNFFIQTSGLSTINLRRLGDDRTLVLINGKRAVSNSGNADRVSLSTLPIGFVERTEVTTGGASAIYGSDAIAGVANFLLEDDFNGFEVDGRYSSPEASGGTELRVNGRVGQNFADDKGYFLFAVSYRDEQMIRADESRPESILAVEFDDPISSTGSDGWTGEINLPGCGGVDTERHCFVPSFSSSTPGGTFEGDAWFVNGQWFNDQSLRPSNRPAGSDFFTDFDGFNFRPGRTLNGSRELFNAALTSSYEFSPELEGSVTVMYSEIDTVTANGFETLNGSDSFGLFNESTIGNIASDHPFIPPEVEETRSGSVSFNRRLVELGEQQRQNNRRTLRTIADLKGQFNENLDWELFATYGKFEQHQYNPNEYNHVNAQRALDIESDGNGGFQCADADARADGCVPINIFGENTITTEAANYIRYNGYATQERIQYTAGGYVSGDLFDVPAGAVKFAAGGEFRREEQDTVGDPDGDQIGGLDGDPTTDDINVTSLAVFPSVVSDYEVIEGFAELDVPIITDQLNLQAAARVGDYNTIGTIFSYNVGAVWSPFEDIRFRTQYSRSQRAPSLTELFSPPRQDADNLADPCEGLQPDGTGIDQPDGDGGENADLSIVSANCLSEAGIQAYFTDPELFDPEDGFDAPGSVNGPNSGNPNVKEETADTFTIGAVYQPSFLPNLTVIADYYQIEIEDAITSISTQNTVDLCYSSADFPNNRFCDVITRNPVTGEVTEVINFQENLNEEKVAGIDVSALYDFEIPSVPGDFNADFRYTHYLDQEVTFTGIGDTQLTTSPLGEIGDGEDEWRLRLRYALDGFVASYTVTYLGGGVDDLLNDPSPDDDRFFEVDGQDFHRVFLSYNWGENDQYRIYGGVNNLFDDLGSVIPTGLDNGSSLNIITPLNDVVGREFFVGTRIRF
jgi:outer membrane receptor protein involved in Fe transport